MRLKKRNRGKSFARKLELQAWQRYRQTVQGGVEAVQERVALRWREEHRMAKALERLREMGGPSQ